ncbi:MAG: S41 family peptidase [Bacteroidales bacterium]|nr:S41 family peptidase [Bacteroidales bacterium]
MNSRSRTPLIISISLVIGIIIGFFMVPSGNSKEYSVQSGKMAYILSLIDAQYVDKVDMDSLEDEAIRSFLADLDPHSVYMTAEEIKKENEGLQGNFDGIGVQFRIIEDTIVVVQPIVQGPSHKAGIMAGDRIVEVDDSIVCGKGITNEDVFKLLKGKKGTKVKLGIKRHNIEKTLNFTIKRDAIPIHSVDYSGMIDNSTGYIKLSQFSANSYQEVHSALVKLKGQGMKQLVFDLRGNGGGYLDQAVKIADEFLVDKDLIVFTNGRYRGRNDYFATNKGVFEEGKIIVLIDEIAASASEIVAGALQDNDRGMIIGRRTFGKGLVQEQKELPDGSALRLTVSRYYTPSGRCIQRPYISGDPEKYYTDFIERYVNMEKHTDTISHADSLKYKTKKGRIVYGGGGIEPDVELPYYVYKKSDYYSTLLKKGLIYKFCFDHIDRNRKAFKQYKDGADFLNKFSVTENLLQEMLSFATEQKVEKENLSDTESSEIKQLMKSYIAQNLYGDEYFYPLFLLVDEDVQKALPYFKK